MPQGYYEVGSGESYDNQTVNNLTVLILEGGKASNTTLNAGGEMDVYSTAVANIVTVNSGGSLLLHWGANANNATVNSGGRVFVSAGCSMNKATVNSGGVFDVFSGGTATGVTVQSGGSLWVEILPGTYAKGSVNGYAFEMNSGRISGYTIFGGCGLNVYNGGTVTNTVVASRGTLNTDSGGTAYGTTVNSGGSFYMYGGIASSTTLNSRAKMYLYYDGTAIGTTVNSGAYMNLTGGSATGIVENGGYVTDTDARFVSYASNTIKGLTLSGTSATVHSGTTATGARVNDSGLFHVLRGGIASGTEVNSGGSMVAFSSSTVYKTTVNDGGYFRVAAGSNTANDTTVNDGGVFYVSGTANGVTVNCGNGSEDGGVWGFSGGIIRDATVNPDGYLRFSAGCSGVDIVENGGYVWLPGESDDDDGQAYVTFKPNTFSGVQLNGKWCTLHSGTTANETKVGSEGIMCIFSHGVANNTSVGAGGKLWIYDGGMADGLVAGSGAELNIGGGGWITGRMTFEAGATIVSGNEGFCDFDLRQTTPGGAALVNNLSVVPKTFYFSLTINGSLTNGTYKLATGAAGFDQTVWVTNIADGWHGSLTVGGPARNFEGHGYSLILGADDVLSVTVGDAVPMGTKSDVDGNGVSDVMFQYTGGDNQLGFWMNGTNAWKGNGLPHPAEWEVLGAYDMNSNGKADAVLVGNVVVSGEKGAYIGYYADSDDADANWVNIGYLTNEKNIDWKNAIGNLTGTPGANSIVWYTHELGALGAWTDGTENWVSIASGFDSNWSLVGCGDFNGDGRDQVVMSLNKGAQYYAVGIDGVFTDLGNSDSGWEISAIGDFSGDGRDDIIAFHKETGIVAKWADGNSANWSQVGQLDAKDWFVVGAGDYNADAKDDLLVRQYSTGMLGYYASGDTTQWTELGRGVDMDWTVIA